MSEQDVFDALRYRIDIDEFGTRHYYSADNRLHRTDGPAVLWTTGDSFWFQNGQLHRTDGPAIEYSDGRKFWYLNHRPLTEDEFNQAVKTL